MPYNQTMAEQKLFQYETRLRNLLITDIPTTIPKPDSNINKIIEYYNNLYKNAKADDHQTIDGMLQDYEKFVSGLEAVKAGTLGIEEMAKRINENTELSYINVFKHNTVQICASIFWLSTAISLYVSLFLIALPMLLVQAPIGIFVGITLGGFLLASIKKITDCFSNFQSLEPHSNDHQNKHLVLNFFKPAQAITPDQTKAAEIQEEKQDDQNVCNASNL